MFYDYKREDGGVFVLVYDIEKLRLELCHLLDSNCSYDEIYRISVELDKLIMELYNNQKNNQKKN